MSLAVRVAQVRVAVRHPLGDELGDAGSLLDPHRGGAPQVGDLDGLAEHRHRIRRQRQQAVDGVADLGGLEDLPHQLEGTLELRVEVVGRERQLGRGQRRLLVGRDVVGVVEDRPVGVRPDLHRTGRLPLVAERVHVAHDRVGDLLAALLEQVDRADVGHLVHGRCQRDRRPGHRRDPRAPHAAGDRHVLEHSMRPRSVTTARTTGRPAPGSTSMSSTSVLANTWRDALGHRLVTHQRARCRASRPPTRSVCRSRRGSRRRR